MLKLDSATPDRAPAPYPAAHPAALAWTVGEHGLLQAETGPFLLEVHPDGVGGYSRFLILRREHDAPSTGCRLVSSGSREGVPAALSSAEQALQRLRRV
jgi:hypothetical protein